MDNSKKFIIVQSEAVANQLVANGFVLLSNIGGIYTFINKEVENFNFSSIDITKIHFTNKLYI